MVNTLVAINEVRPISDSRATNLLRQLSIEMVSIRQISCATRQKLGNLRSQTGNFVATRQTKLSDKVAQLCCVSDIGLRMPPPPRKIIKQIAGQSKLNFGKSKYVLNFISFECQTRIADKLSCRIGRIGNHRPILSSLLITLHLAPPGPKNPFFVSRRTSCYRRRTTCSVRED